MEVNGFIYNDHPNDQRQPSFQRRMELSQRQRALTSEIQSVEEDIARLQALKRDLNVELQKVKQELETHTIASHNALPLDNGVSSRPAGGERNASNGRSSHNKAGFVDYFSMFEWSEELRKRMQQVFGFEQFRLCQEGICNASMDNRDIVAVMPTGGGKSLTYQLPALLCSGTTLVISPLISLITDQILHLHEAGVEACMLTGAASKEEQRSILQRLTQNSSKGKGPAHGGQNEIKLVYVTPEKIAKSKTFLSALQKMANNGTLVRIVIDEAHCVSQLGHDFRPDYQKLSILRQLFPHVPILALSATCPPKVLQDLLKILRMDSVVDGNSAPAKGTVYFSSPLYRKNLHYRVVQKPASASDVIDVMAKYITEEHSGHTGIIYCLSKKDAETVATGLQEVSSGKIRTGVYHADIGDAEKERLHKRWRKGEVKVVCATIAFGLGIDKGDVRFVLHHSMSKSLDGFYQESGRAGRDGKDSDCILYYRGQDVSRLSALVCGEREGQIKLHDMLRFAQDLQECRKLQFAKYFSASSSLSLSAWSAEGSENLSRCGHCDNCTRGPDSLDSRDVTIESWKIVRIAKTIETGGGRVTLGMLSDLVRGAGGGAFEAGGGGRGKNKNKVRLDLDDVCRGKVELHKDDVESLLITLLLLGYLKEEYVTNAYAINVYLVPGQQALRLSRLSKDDVESGKGPQIVTTFLKREKTRRISTAPGNKRSSKKSDIVPPTRLAKDSASDLKGKGKPPVMLDDDSEAEESILAQGISRKVSYNSEPTMRTKSHPDRKPRGATVLSKRKRVEDSEEEEIRNDASEENEAFSHENQSQATAPEDDSEDDWSFSFGLEAGGAPKNRGSHAVQPVKKRPKVSSSRDFTEMDIIELSD
ncbi:ATP-dependent DNA helicase [Serendipita vermifera]|nr:ATP-dependent DNA helicase [Serendipita vermifera]